jgi:hypothetical protein
VAIKIFIENSKRSASGHVKIIRDSINVKPNLMNTFLKMLGLAAALAFALFVGQVRAQDEQYAGGNVSQNATVPQNGGDNVSFQTFYDQLASQGTWIQTDKYGYVFQPTEKDPNWRPYTYGHWVNTDAGMTWVSDEPFGWATYHYGRWVNIDGSGWVWVPGYTWAPAWVSWRDSDDYVGWAPLPPDSDVGIGYYDDEFDWGFGFHIGDDCDLAYGIGPWCYNFCPVAFIGDRDCWRHFGDPRDNFALIGRTRNVTNLNFRRDGAGQFGRVHAGGPSVAALNARSRTAIQQARLTGASSPAAAGLRGNTLAAFAPSVDPATVKTARPGSVSGTLANASVNRGTNINNPLTVTHGIRGASATPAQIHAATLAQGNALANAKVAGVNTQPSRALTRSLTTLRPTANTGGVRSNATVGGSVKPSTAIGANAGVSSTAMGNVSRRTTISSGAASPESAFTGAPTARHTLSPSSAQSTSPGAPTTTRHTFSSSSAGSSYYHPSTSIYHSSTPSYYHSQSSASMFHSSAPAYQSQSSFHSYAPAAHYSGGGFSGGGRSSGGGGAVRSSGGGGGGRGGSGKH